MLAWGWHCLWLEPTLSDNTLLKTPLHGLHLSLGARMVPFAGYDMPVQYPAGLMAEHKHTRAAAGLFDVSHMGQIRLVGTEAARAFTGYRINHKAGSFEFRAQQADSRTKTVYCSFTYSSECSFLHE